MLTNEALKNFKKLGDRLDEDHLRAYVVSEIADNIHDPVAMNYALEEAGGDEQKTMAYYTKHLIRIIDDELKLKGILVDAANREKTPSIIAQMFQNLLSAALTIILIIVLLFLLFWLPQFLV